MKYVVYLIDQPFDARNYERFGIQLWINRGWRVEVWDLTPLSQPKGLRNFNESGGAIKQCPEYLPIYSSQQLSRRFDGPDCADYFIDLAGNSFYCAMTKMYLTRCGSTRVICSIGSMPEEPEAARRGMAQKFRRAAEAGPSKFVKWLTDAVLNRAVARFAKPGLAVVSGERSVSVLPTPVSYPLVKAHNLDYDRYLRLRNGPSSRKRSYAVFLDQDLCFHPDYIYDDIPLYASPNRYFPTICRGLRDISTALGVEVLIAAHPRATYRKRGRDYLEGIPIEYHATPELIRDCDVVVGHGSTAIQFAILFAKPVIFVTTDELAVSPLGPLISIFAAELGKSAINLDADTRHVNWHGQLSIDAGRYAEYRNRHIKIDGTPEQPYWKILIDHVEALGLKQACFKR